MKRQLFSTLCILAGLTAAPVLANPHDHPGGPAGREEQQMSGHMMEKLHLSGDQKAQFQALHQRFMPEMQRLHETLKAQRDKIQALLREEKTSTAELRAALDRRSELQAQRSKLQADHLLDMFQLLTPAQRVTFADMHPQHGGHDD